MREDGLVAHGEEPGEAVAPGVAIAEVPGNLGLDTVKTLPYDLGNPGEVAGIPREEGQPGPEVFILQEGRPGGHERFHFGVENRRQGVGELTRALVMLVVDVPGEVHGARSDRDLERSRRIARGERVEVDEAQRPWRDWPAVHDRPPVSQQGELLGERLPAAGSGVVFLGGRKAGN